MTNIESNKWVVFHDVIGKEINRERESGPFPEYKLYRGKQYRLGYQNSIVCHYEEVPAIDSEKEATFRIEFVFVTSDSNESGMSGITRVITMTEFCALFESGKPPTDWFTLKNQKGELECINMRNVLFLRVL